MKTVPPHAGLPGPSQPARFEPTEWPIPLEQPAEAPERELPVEEPAEAPEREPDSEPVPA